MHQTCALAIHRTDSGYLFRIDGRGTMRESVAVRDFVCGALEKSDSVVVDLNDCDYLDSTFLGCLLVMHQRSSSCAAKLSIFATDSARQRLLATLRLDRVLSFAEELPECVGAAATLEVSEVGQPEFASHLIETHRKLAELGGPAANTFHAIADDLAREEQ